MIKNYLRTAWRNILKNKAFSFINIFGLTAGTVCCLYMVLYVKEQYGYDAHHTGAGSLYRVRTVIERKGDEKDFNSASSSPPIAMAMKQDFPEVAAATRVQYFTDQGDYLLGLPESDNTFFEPNGYLADSTFFQVFDYRFTEGSPLHALDEPYTVVLSSAVARKLFGKANALNQPVMIGNRDNSHAFKVTGVFDETWGKSHLQPHYIMNMNSGGLGEFIRSNNQWAGQNFIYTYVRLNPHADALALQAKLPAFLQKYGADNLKELGMNKHLYLQPVTDIHLYSKGIGNQIDKTSDAGFLYLLLTIAFFIQLIACINFINLTTARSMRRAREIGVRKVVGAGRSALVVQFLGESVLVAFMAVLLAIPLVALLLPYLNRLTDTAFAMDALTSFSTLAIVFGLGLATGLLAGIYPALYLSGFRPVQVLKSAFRIRASSGLLRKGLVVFQFVIAIVLIISVIVISRQLTYLQSQELGFDPHQKIVIPLKTDPARQQYTAFSHELAKLKEIGGVTGCLYYPTKNVLNDFRVYTAGRNMNDARNVKVNRADEHFFPVMGIRLLTGRNLTPADTNNQVVTNEMALKALKIDPDKAIGTRLYNEYEGSRAEYEIVGVTNDYNYNTLREEVYPLITLYSQRPGYVVADIRSDQYASLLPRIGAAWKKTMPGLPFEYSFIDQDIQQLYTEENTLRKISNSFTILAILISCLGLFGLAMFTAQQRVKEIGVRKVLGASITGIISMLSKDFLKLVLVSILLATPLAWWVMHRWLEDFAYKTPVHWWIFAVAGLAALTVAFITVSFQAIRAALANPVQSLRTE
ncbi:MAG: ABC transporter permease [Chitinophagaceae bacterium]